MQNVLDKHHYRSVMTTSTPWVGAVECPERHKTGLEDDHVPCMQHASAFFSPSAKTSKEKENCPEVSAMQDKVQKGKENAVMRGVDTLQTLIYRTFFLSLLSGS
jgi:hypothetical protein